MFDTRYIKKSFTQGYRIKNTIILYLIVCTFFILKKLSTLSIFSKILAEVKRTRQNSSEPFWVGVVNPSNNATKGVHTGNWTYLNGKPAEDLLFDWHPAEPDNRYGNESCARVWGNNELYDFGCDYSNMVLCQVPTVC